MNENERYDEICKPNFEKTDKKLDKVLYLLQGNGKPGLISRIERIEMKCQTASGILGFAVKNWQMLVVVILIALNMVSAKEIDPSQIKEIAKQVKSLEILTPNPESE